MSNDSFEQAYPGALEQDMADVTGNSAMSGITKGDFRRFTNQGSLRNCWIHLPPDAVGHEGPYNLLVHLDGDETIKK